MAIRGTCLANLEYLGDVEIVAEVENLCTLRTEVCVAVIIAPSHMPAAGGYAPEAVRISLQLHDADDVT
jgi:hypothetical protein